MKRILDPIRVEHVDGRRWLLLEPFEYRLGSPEGHEAVLVPAGFLTDFASVPRALWAIFPPTGKHSAAALVHDWLYHHPIVLDRVTGVLRTVTRAEADQIFLDAMTVLGVSWPVRRLMYRAVRVFGAGAYLP